MNIKNFKEQNLYFKTRKNILMNKETRVLLAGSIGLLTVLGIFKLRKLLKIKKQNEENEIPEEHHFYGGRYQAEDGDGVEFLALL